MKSALRFEFHASRDMALAFMPEAAITSLFPFSARFEVQNSPSLETGIRFSQAARA